MHGEKTVEKREEVRRQLHATVVWIAKNSSHFVIGLGMDINYKPVFK